MDPKKDHTVPWTCGTRRHRATGQRYAVTRDRVKPADPAWSWPRNPFREPVENRLPGPSPQG
jgi:hypothetical protein